MTGTILKTGFQSVFKKNYVLWIVLAVLLLVETVFLLYTITCFRHISYDCSLESPDYCYTVTADSMTLEDVRAIERELKGRYGKNGCAVSAYLGEDGFGNPVYLAGKYFHNSSFRSYGKKRGVFPDRDYKRGESVRIGGVSASADRTAETDVVQINAAGLPGTIEVEHASVRFARPLSGRVCAEMDGAFGKGNLSRYRAEGKPASKPVPGGESFINLNVAFFFLIIAVVSFAVWWINLKSRDYYRTLYLIGHGWMRRRLPAAGICFAAVVALSAAGAVLFRLIFYLPRTEFFVGAFYAADYFIVLGIETLFVLTAVFAGQTRAVRSHE